MDNFIETVYALSIVLVIIIGLHFRVITHQDDFNEVPTAYDIHGDVQNGYHIVIEPVVHMEHRIYKEKYEFLIFSRVLLKISFIFVLFGTINDMHIRIHTVL